MSISVLGSFKSGLPYDNLYMPTALGSTGGGPKGGEGGGRLWFNITDTMWVDGQVTANGLQGNTTGGHVSGGGSGGSVMLHCYHLKGYGLIQTSGGAGSAYQTHAGGGGAGGRIAMYFSQNTTFSEFRFLASGGLAGQICDTCEAGGPGTVFLYHLVEDHRTLIIDNDNAPRPRDKYVNWNNVEMDGGRAWILPGESGLHDFAGGAYRYTFEEFQVYGNGDLAILPPEIEPTHDVSIPALGPEDLTLYPSDNYNTTLLFKYMIGDRTGALHLAAGQVMDLNRPEIDLPFSSYVYYGAYLGLAPTTFIHGVEIHLSGILANVINVTLHHGGYLWLKHGGRTLNETYSQYWFDIIRIQDHATVNATTDPINEPGITFFLYFCFHKILPRKLRPIHVGYVLNTILCKFLSICKDMPQIFLKPHVFYTSIFTTQG